MKESKCHNCAYQINKKQDLYYLFTALRRNSLHRDTSYLHLCDKCFHTNADSHLINRLNELSGGELQATSGNNWRTCPYCKETLPYSKVDLHFQLSEIIGSDINSLVLHSKCYHTNIGISEDEFAI